MPSWLRKFLLAGELWVRAKALWEVVRSPEMRKYLDDLAERDPVIAPVVREAKAIGDTAEKVFG